MTEKRVCNFPRKPSHYFTAIEPKKAGRFSSLSSAYRRSFSRYFLTLMLRPQKDQQAAIISSQVT